MDWELPKNVKDAMSTFNQHEKLPADLTSFDLSDCEMSDNEEATVTSSSDCEHEETPELEVSDCDHEEALDVTPSSNFSDCDYETAPEVTTSLSGCELSDNEEGDIIVHQNSVQSTPLIFPCLPSSWFSKQGSLCEANCMRTKIRSENGAISSDGLLSMNRSKVPGTLESNINNLLHCIEKETCDSRIKHMHALVDVARYILKNGSIVSTQDAGKVYTSSKEQCLKHYRMNSNHFYDIFSKHLNIIQIYVCDKAYLVHTDSRNVNRLLNSLVKDINVDAVVNGRAKERLENVFKTSLQYMDTHRDKKVLIGLMAALTSVNFTKQLQGLKSQKGTVSAKKSLFTNLDRYGHIRETSQIVRNDLDVRQQHLLTERIIYARKLKEIRTIQKGRGRKLKSHEFPELAAVLEYAFGEHDVQRGGGGLEAHPRLTTGTMYKACDSITTMKDAREMLLSLAPRGFTISLSSCYNYTENYREGSFQAKRHHAGKDVNASVSLRKPPRTGVDHLVINLHWSTANVNHLIDLAEEASSSVTISKDAKAIIPADIAPVQRPGHSWRKKDELPDHTWDQSRTNSITPMTFLFLKTKVTSTITEMNIPIGLQNTTLHITRSGKGVTLLYFSFFESATTLRCMNEILLLLSLSALDSFFRDSATGTLKKEFKGAVDLAHALRSAQCSVHFLF